MKRFIPQASAFIVAILFGHLVNAQDRLLRILVVDLEGKPIPGIQLSARGASSVGITTDDGKVTIVLAPQTAANSEVKLYIVDAPKEYVFISPWESQIRVPPFDNATSNSVQVVLAEKGLRALLEDHRALVAAAEAIKRAADWRIGKEILPREKRVETLTTVAEVFGLDPKDLDQALRELEEKAKDPYEKGMSAFYTENYSEAEKYLRESAQIRTQQLRDAERKLAETEREIAHTLFKQERYEDATPLLRRVLNVNKDDGEALVILTVNLTFSGKFEEAEPLYKSAINYLKKEQDNKREVGAILLQCINYVGQKKYKDAEHILARLYLSESGDTEIRETAAALQMIAYWIQGEYSKAESVYPKLNGLIDPDIDPDSLSELRKSLRLDDKEFLAVYKGILDTIDREKPGALTNVGAFLEEYSRLLRKNGKKKEALTIEKRANDFRAEQQNKSQKD
jgi:tetratricopeptide (TPR) repeat protein